MSLVSCDPRQSVVWGQEQGFVNAGSLVSFVSDVGKQNRADVQNSILLAQLAADKKFNREKQTKEWYDYYRKVLSKVGWVIQGFQFEQYQSNGETLKVSNAILDVIHDVASADEFKAVQRTIQSLQASGNQAWWDLFNRKSGSPNTYGNDFQVVPCKEDKSGQVVIGIASFHFSAKIIDERWLWYDYSSSDISLYKGIQISTLNKSVYDQVRDEIIEKLGDNAKDFIGDLDI